jgi:hypothetical protein
MHESGDPKDNQRIGQDQGAGVEMASGEQKSHRRHSDSNTEARDASKG